MTTKSGIKGCKVQVYWGHTRVTLGDMVVDGGDDHVWYFYGNEATPLQHAPISSKKLIILATEGATTRPLVNYELEPIEGTLTVPAAMPAYDSIEASYYYYNSTPLDLTTRGFRVETLPHSYDVDIYNQPHYCVHNQYPSKVKFDLVLTSEAQRNLLTESLMHSYYFILIDNQIDAGYGLRAYEGPIRSDEQWSVYKGENYLLPIEMDVQNFGIYDSTSDTIDWTAYWNA